MTPAEFTFKYWLLNRCYISKDEMISTQVIKRLLREKGTIASVKSAKDLDEELQLLDYPNTSLKYPISSTPGYTVWMTYLTAKKRFMAECEKKIRIKAFMK